MSTLFFYLAFSVILVYQTMKNIPSNKSNVFQFTAGQLYDLKEWLQHAAGHQRLAAALIRRQVVQEQPGIQQTLNILVRLKSYHS